MNKICIFLVLLIVFVGCNDNPSSVGQKLYVVTTTGMITDVVVNVGGEHVRVDGLMGPGVDPHLYKATALDTKKLAEAQLIIYNGLHLEGKMGNILTKMGREKRVYAVTEDIPAKLLREPPEFSGLYDPHIWFDVSLWKSAVGKIEEALVASDPAHAESYRRNAQQYLQKLDELHNWVKQEIVKIPESDRVLVTAHDAFGYFGRAYGVEVVGLQGISTASDYGVKEIEDIVELLVSRKIRAVFVESSVPKKSIEAVVEGCRSRSHDVTIGGSLFSDAMGEEGKPEGTYIGMVRHNVETIVNALSSAS